MIHYDIPKPKLSRYFNVDDIHKIREWNYEVLKDATAEERRAYIRKRIEPALKRLGKLESDHKADKPA